jgi:hypothetical protein
MTNNRMSTSSSDAKHSVEKAADDAGFRSSAFDFLNVSTHPLTADGRRVSRAQAIEVLGAFSGFSAALPRILTQAHAALSDNAPLALRYELLLNLSEELGYVDAPSEWVGLSHHNILCREVRSLFGTDLTGFKSQPHTTRFLEGLFEEISRGDPWTFGAMVALEISAIPEITLVREMVDRVLRDEGLTWPVNLQRFFDAHISDFEVQHSRRLLAVSPEILVSPKIVDYSRSSYFSVRDLMREWWRLNS